MAEQRPDPLRPFQRRVFDALLKGRSVILQAPTGAGKTRAALSPFLQNLAYQGEKLPLTCRYAVPLRVLANQFFREYHQIAEDIDRRMPTRLVEAYRRIGRPAVALQTGEQPDDPQFESALTFCTIDQLLASFLAIPYGMGTNRANLNVGGVIGSYLVLDEFHLYPLLREGKNIFGARTTALQMLRLLRSLTPFVLMTATFSTTLLQRLQELLDAEIVTVTDGQELEEIAQGRARTFYRADAPMDAGDILDEHRQRARNRCTLVVCNTVLRAQQLYLHLREAEKQGTRVVLLHSRFTQEDRRRLSQEIEDELGPGQWKDGIYQGRDLIVIATQVVEVGLDISVEVLHTEIAPANSLIQRAGRCARFARQQGSVIVYPLPLDVEGKPARSLPYDEERCATTWQALEQFHGRVMGFVQEQDLINAVHTQEDQDLLEHYTQYEPEIRKLLTQSFTSNDRGASSSLIRDVSQVQVIIHDDPDTAIQETPWRWQSFGINPFSLSSEKRWAALQGRAQEHDLEWVCREAIPVALEEQAPDGADGIENNQKTVYRWQPLASREAIPQALFLALPHQLARYDSQLGFVLLDGQLPSLEPNDYQSTLLPRPAPSVKGELNGSRQTSYQRHIEGLVSAYTSHQANELRYVIARLENTSGFATGTVDQAIRLALGCHDLGKLSRTWQQWALAWQRLVWEREGWGDYRLPDPTFCFAKTDFDRSPRQRQWQREVQPKRPCHACESVVIARNLIGQSLGISKTERQAYRPVLRATCAAIARHHTSQASQYGKASLDTQALQAAAEALAKAHQQGNWSYDPTQLLLSIAQEGDLDPVEAPTPKLTRPSCTDGLQRELETWLYFVIVRVLRLSDQRADSL